jgi:Spy/CpxP family protein refolding chaperone
MMNKLKLSILSMGIFFASAAIAQEQKMQMSKEQRIEKHMDHLAVELKLSDVQKQQITDLNKSSREKSQIIKNDARLNEAAKKEATQAIRLEKKAEMNQILSEEQALKLKTLKKERKANHKKGDSKKGLNKQCQKDKKDGAKSCCEKKDQKMDYKPAVK